MRIITKLPKDRRQAGFGVVLDDTGSVCYGPFLCRGEADNRGAADHQNVTEDPTQSCGDHPYGIYRVTAIRWTAHGDVERATHFGPCFLALDPTGGEALTAKQHGRTGLGLHGGQLHDDWTLRETNGCNRVADDVARDLGEIVEAQLQLGHVVDYECRAL